MEEYARLALQALGRDGDVMGGGVVVAAVAVVVAVAVAAEDDPLHH